MFEFFSQLSYPGLFLISFLAATLLPISSEIFVASMIVAKFNPIAVLLVATAGNFCGASTNYFIGKFGGDFVLSKYFKIDQKKQKKAEKFYKKFGAPSLFFSWLPVIGDPLCVVPGILHLNFLILGFFWKNGAIFFYN